MDHEMIASQDIGDSFSGIYYVESSYVRKTRNDKNFMDMVLRDRSGSRPVKFWGVVEGVEKGVYVFVSAEVESYQDSPSIIARNIEPAEAPDDLSDFVAPYEGRDELVDEFISLQDNTLKGMSETCYLVVSKVFQPNGVWDDFISCPSSNGLHYGKEGGLLANVVRVSNLVLDSAKFYGLDEGQVAVLLASAMVCKIGAIDAYSFTDCMPCETDTGILAGMGNLTIARLNKALNNAVATARKEDIELDEEKLIKIVHAVAASHREYGVTPMTIEAMILESIVRMDSEIVDAIEFVAEDQNQNDSFTAFDPRTKRRYYRG